MVSYCLSESRSLIRPWVKDVCMVAPVLQVGRINLVSKTTFNEGSIKVPDKNYTSKWKKKTSPTSPPSP